MRFPASAPESSPESLVGMDGKVCGDGRIAEVRLLPRFFVPLLLAPLIESANLAEEVDTAVAAQPRPLRPDGAGCLADRGRWSPSADAEAAWPEHHQVQPLHTGA